MIKSHYLRPSRKINYSQFFNDDTTSKSSSGDDDSTLDEYITRRRHKLNKKQQPYNNNKTKNQQNNDEKIDNNDLITEDRIFLIDFGLASKFLDSNGQHHQFCLDQRRAHDGTLEFTSRDAHLGAHSRRSDLECLGYNLLLWSQGYLPWLEYAKQQQHEIVHRIKEQIMLNCKIMLNCVYRNEVPKYLIDYMDLVNKLAYHERPNYEKFKRIFYEEFERITIKTTTGAGTMGIHKSSKVLSSTSSITTRQKMILNIDELIKNSIKIDKLQLLENNNSSCEAKNNVKMYYRNLGLLTPLSATLFNFNIAAINTINVTNNSMNNSNVSLNGSNNLLLNSQFFHNLLQNNHKNLNGLNGNITPIKSNNGINHALINGYSTPNNNSPGGGQLRLSPKNLRSKSLHRLSAAISNSAKITSTTVVDGVSVGGGSTTKKRNSTAIQKQQTNSNSKTSNINSGVNKNLIVCAEILNKDPDQIARERCEKEFEREENIYDDTPIRYQGKPTYAILEIQNRIKFKDRLNDTNTTQTTALNNLSLTTTANDLLDDDELKQQLKGFTKPMIDILLKKRKSSLMNTTTRPETPINYQKSSTSATIALETSKLQRPRTKAGLRAVITPTKRGLDYNHSLIQRRRCGATITTTTNTNTNNNIKNKRTVVKNLSNNLMKTKSKRKIKDVDQDESSCSSANSVTTRRSKKSSTNVAMKITTSSSSSQNNTDDVDEIDSNDNDDDDDDDEEVEEKEEEEENEDEDEDKEEDENEDNDNDSNIDTVNNMEKVVQSNHNNKTTSSNLKRKYRNYTSSTANKKITNYRSVQMHNTGKNVKNKIKTHQKTKKQRRSNKSLKTKKTNKKCK